ncbi:uncharacterized protein HKW66_Vig0035140 [Vigna angularis]|uniref:Uncharacterized protein n=1 Tax=Phaseolus angularis TaxID=3914 RepID=A0A8T0LAU5_PHAAN|nr:uncharacterized protein HKW66_Vig0035140 [Vigna angularis]
MENRLQPSRVQLEQNLVSSHCPSSKRHRSSSRCSEPEPVDEKHGLIVRLKILAHIALLCFSHPRKRSFGSGGSDRVWEAERGRRGSERESKWDRYSVEE